MAGIDGADAAAIAARVDALIGSPNPHDVADEAMRLARRGLVLITARDDPDLWIRLQLALGRLALMTGYDRDDLPLLNASIAANAAVLELGSAVSAFDWFRAAYNGALGQIYVGRLTDDARPLEQAARQLRSILRVLPRDAPEGRWASCMNTLGTALQNAGLCLGRSRPARRATLCYRIAARAYAAAGFPDDARNSTYNEGLAWIVVGDLTGDPGAYDTAISVFGQVLADASPERDLRDWAKIVDAMARARANRGDVTGDARAIAQAVAECESVVARMTRQSHPGWWSMVMGSLCDFRLRLATLGGDPAGMVAAAEGAAEGLQVALPETMPAYWLSLMRTAARARLQLGTQTGDPAQIGQAIRFLSEIVEADRGGRRERAAILTLRGRAATQLAALLPRDESASLADALDDFDAALALTDRHAAPALWTGIMLARAQARRRLATRRRDADALSAAIGDFGAVLAALPEAEGSPRRGEAMAGIARARLARALIARADDPGAVADELGRAAAGLRGDLDPAASIRLGRDRATALLLARDWQRAAAEAGDQIDRAAALLAAEPAEHERLRLAHALAGTGDVAAYALLRLGRVDEALARHEQGRAHRLRARLRLAEGALDETRMAELDRLRRRADLSRRALAQAIEQGRPSAAIARLDAALAREHGRLTAAMARAGLDGGGEAPTLASVGRAMGDGVVALPVMTPVGGALLVIGGRDTGLACRTVWLDGLTTGAIGDLLSPAEGDGWLDAFAVFRGALADGGAPAGADAVALFQAAIARTAGACWNLLMEPLDRALREAGLPIGSEVVMIPDGRLSALPLHAAGTADGAFLDRWAVSHAPSLAALLACRREAAVRGGAQGRLLAVTDPGLDLGRIANPAATAIAAGRVDALHGPAATRAAVIAALPDADYASFFSHALWDPVHPERSALQLAGGDRLSAGDLALLDLRRCRMAVLGACESGVPGLTIAADEFRGMPAALLEAGIPGVLATLWPVFTDTVDRIVADFMRHHVVEGMTPARALRRAQLSLRDAGARTSASAPMGMRRSPAAAETAAKAGPAHDLGLPAHWAAFAYIGA